MSDEAALLAAILAHPDEDTPRLMFADWLQENGQSERAEFIRIQCAPDADEAAEARAVELEERNRSKWLVGIPQFSEARWEFRRGFPDFLHVAGELFLERYEAFARVPWLRSLWLVGLSPWDLRDFANQPWEPQWIELAIAMVVSSDASLRNGPAFVALANCSRLAQLRQITLFREDLDPDCVQALAASPYIEMLQQIRLFGYHSELGEDELLDPLRERFGDRLVSA